MRVFERGHSSVFIQRNGSDAIHPIRYIAHESVGRRDGYRIA